MSNAELKLQNMVIYDEGDPTKVIHISAPTPGHFNYIESAFQEKYPNSKRLVVQEVNDFPEEGKISENPTDVSGLVLLGIINGRELSDLIARGSVPERVKRKSSKGKRAG